MVRPDRPAPGVERGVEFAIESGVVELRDEPDGSTTVLVNRVPSSTLHLSPERLDFEYMRHISAVVKAWGGEPKFLAVHLGGGACTLPRHLAYAYPESRHIVVEADATLVEMARDWWDIPRAPRVRVRHGEALTELSNRHDDSADIIVRDAFAGDSTPDHLTDDGFWAQARRVLRPGGLVIANVIARPRSSAAREDAKAALRHFAHSCILGDPRAAGGKRIGNLALVAGNRVPSAALRRYAASAPLPTVVREGWPS